MQECFKVHFNSFLYTGPGQQKTLGSVVMRFCPYVAHIPNEQIIPTVTKGFSRGTPGQANVRLLPTVRKNAS